MTSYNNAYLPALKEKMIKSSKGIYMISIEHLTPTSIHQAYDDLMKFEKEFSALINLQRDRERNIK